VTWFLANGASPNVRHNSDNSTTPLTCAVISACPAIVSLLLDQGARVDRGNVLSALCESKHPGRLYILGLLIQRGAPVNAVDDSQNLQRLRLMQVRGLGAPLHRAVEEGRVAIAAALLAHGADKAVRDTKGRTPVELAKELGRAEIAALLEAE
jgi:ankyrin repeat protein